MRVVTVCLGNICRSPAAAALLNDEAQRAGLDIDVDSAGTSRYHLGDPPHPTSQAVAHRRGIEVTGTARQITMHDFEEADLILAMDRHNEADLMEMAPTEAARQKIKLLRSFDPDADALDVPDPYYGDKGDYERMYDLLVPAVQGVVRHLASHTRP